MKVVVEGVGPEQDAVASILCRRTRRTSPKPGDKCAVGKPRKGTLGRDSGSLFCQVRQTGGLRHEVDELGRERRHPRPSVDPPHRVGGAWPQTALVVMR